MSQGKKGYQSLRKKIKIEQVTSKKFRSQYSYQPVDLMLNLSKSTYFIMDIVNRTDISSDQITSTKEIKDSKE